MTTQSVEPACLPEAIERIVHRFDPLQIILFGSWARGEARPDSDLDLLVVLPAVENKLLAMMEAMRALNGLPASKDVIVTTPEEIQKGETSSEIFCIQPYGKVKWFMHEPESKRWMQYAQVDLDAGNTLLRDLDDFPRQIGYQAQPAAEKAIKAIFVLLEITHPYTHDLDRLRDLLPDGWRVKTKYPDLAELTIWAIVTRYPADMPDIVKADAIQALKTAEGIMHLIEEDIAEYLKSNPTQNERT